MAAATAATAAMTATAATAAMAAMAAVAASLVKNQIQLALSRNVVKFVAFN
jgi:hypothetical protein